VIIWGSGSLSEKSLKFCLVRQAKVHTVEICQSLTYKNDIEHRAALVGTVKMRNLRNIRHEQWSPPAHFQGRPLTAATWDLANDSVLCAFGPTEDNALLELVRVKPEFQ
jgi:hypothetical protein